MLAAQPRPIHVVVEVSNSRPLTFVDTLAPTAVLVELPGFQMLTRQMPQPGPMSCQTTSKYCLPGSLGEAPANHWD